MEHCHLLEAAAEIANVQLHRAGFVPDAQTANAIVAYFSRLQALEEELCADTPNTAVILAAVRCQLAVNKSTLAPIRRLPPELLMEIFSHVTATTRKRHPTRRLELRIAGVCYYWRMVALGASALWSSIDVRIKCAKEDLRWADAAEIYLQRSQQRHLRLAFDAKGHRKRLVEGTRGSAVWQSIMNQSHRIASLRLSRIPNMCYEDLEGRPFPTLRDLRLDFALDSLRDPCANPLKSFSGAPHVQKLHLHFAIDPLKLIIPSNWRLTHLTIICDSERRDLLQQSLWACLQAIEASCAAHLEDCRILANSLYSRATIDPNEILGQRSIHFPALKRIDFESRGGLALLSSMIAPALESVTLTAPRLPGIGCLGSFAFMLQRSGACPRLKTLELRRPFDVRSTLDCLRQLPSLPTLKLRLKAGFEETHLSVLVFQRLLQVLTRDEAKPDSLLIAPRLSRLVFTTGMEQRILSYADGEVMERTVRDMMQSRQKKGLLVQGQELAVAEVATDYLWHWLGDDAPIIKQANSPSESDRSDTEGTFQSD
ncbi:hypothetical protein HDZ31DRAFT_41563 [Schizophyllum fasciatum]